MQLDVNFVIYLMGAAFVFLGLYIRLGNMKKAYWKSPRSITGYVPLGLVFLVAGYYETASQQAPYFFYAYIALFVVLVGLTIFLGARPPQFVKPRWVRWVEKYPRSVQKAMAAASEDEPDWEKNVATEAAVDAWAKKLSRKGPKKS